MARQEGFQRGARWREKVTTSGSLQPQVAEDVIVREAKKAFPLQKVERPRVVTDPHAGGYEWRISESGKAEWRCTSACAGSIAKEFHHPGAGNEVCTVTAERVKMWADLLAHPSEFVDDEG